MISRIFCLLVVAALAATPACAADSDTSGASPISKMEKKDKEAEPEAPTEESRVQVPDLPRPTGEKPPVPTGVAKPDKADPPAEKPEHHHDADNAAGNDYGPATLHMMLSPTPKIEKGKESHFTLTLLDDGDKRVGADALEERHTKKIHLLVADEGLSDYQHVHPAEGREDWSFSFTPATGHNYMLWADVKPKDGKPQMIPFLLKGEDPCKTPCVDQAPSLAAAFGDNKAVLKFDGPLKIGAPATATLDLTGKDGSPLKGLEPVMGAYAHVAAFPADGSGVAHVHPMGASPEKPEDRGASPLSFMLHPDKPGMLKLFVQIGMDNKDIFLPFTVKVEDAPKK